MIVFCSFQQLNTVIEYARRYGFRHYIPLVFCKNSSAQVLKANMKIVGATEYGLVLYRDKLPKFRNDGNMVLNWFLWEQDGKNIPRIHPTQKAYKTVETADLHLYRSWRCGNRPPARVAELLCVRRMSWDEAVMDLKV